MAVPSVSSEVHPPRLEMRGRIRAVHGPVDPEEVLRVRADALQGTVPVSAFVLLHGKGCFPWMHDLELHFFPLGCPDGKTACAVSRQVNSGSHHVMSSQVGRQRT